MIRTELQENLQGLNGALQDYAKHTRRSVAEIVARKGLSIIMGNSDPRFGMTFKGLYQRLRERTPKEGEITADAMRRLRNAPRGTQPLKVRERALAKADEMLEGRKSGVFTLMQFGRGRMKARPVRYAKRDGRRLIGRNPKAGVGKAATRSQLREGDAILNRRSLANILELGMREAGRGYTSLSFIAGRFLRVFRRGKAEDKELTLSNLKGTRLGQGALSVGGVSASFGVQGFVPGQQKAVIQSIAADVVNDVRRDTMAYVERKERDRIDREFRRITR